MQREVGCNDYDAIHGSTKIGFAGHNCTCTGRSGHGKVHTCPCGRKWGHPDWPKHQLKKTPTGI